jgi:hypothetical protein
MSIECLNQALKIEGLTPTKKLILVLLANYADEKGTCYPSYKHIAKIVGLKTVKGIQKAIKEFEELGLLKIEHRILENGSYTSNKYHLMLGGFLKDPTPIKVPSLGSLETNNTKDNTKTINVNLDIFEEFWKIYPRKVGKKSALKIFYKYNEKNYKKIIFGAKCFAKENIENDIKYIPHPTTWLNQERWVDYFETDKHGNVIQPKQIKKISNLAG